MKVTTLREWKYNPETKEYELQDPTVRREDYAVIRYLFDEAVPSGAGYMQETGKAKRTGWTTELLNTAYLKFSVNVLWRDNNNAYGTRPEEKDLKGLLKLYRYRAGDTPSSALPYGSSANLSVTEGETAGTWQVTGVDLPGYTDTADSAYIYYIKLEDFDADNSSDGDVYTVECKNTGNFGSRKDAVFAGGTAVCLLTNKVPVKVHKSWKDGKPTDSIQNDRPSCTLYLYRQASDGPTYELALSSPVRGYDSLPVPKMDGDIVFASESEPLDKYDINGCRYVYYVLERGVTGAEDYSMQIDSASTGVFIAEDGNDSTAYQLAAGMGGSDGILINKHEGTTVAPVSKTMVSGATQSLQGIESTLQLQYWADGAWHNVQADGKNVTLTLKDFSEEQMTRSGDVTKAEPALDSLPKYDEEGHLICYRWTETSIRMGKDAETVSIAVNPGAPAENPGRGDELVYGYPEYNVGDIIKGSYGATTAFLQPQLTVRYEGGSWHSELTNTLNAKYKIKVNKTWTVQDKTYSEVTDYIAGNTVRVRIRCSNGTVSGETEDASTLKDLNGRKITDLILTREDWDESVTDINTWTDILTNLPRFDENGAELTYTLDEAEITGETGSWFKSGKFNIEPVTEDGVTLLQMTAVLHNSQGDTPALRFEVVKYWHDNGDLLSRRPVRVVIANIHDSSDVHTAVLNESNCWQDIVSLAASPKPDGGYYGLSDYVLYEAALDAGETLIPADYGTDDPAEMREALSAGGLNGVIDERDKDGRGPHNLEYVYLVTVKETSRDQSGKGGTGKYEITNTRYATADLKLTKTWHTGGTAPAAAFSVQCGEEDFCAFILSPDTAAQTCGITWTSGKAFAEDEYDISASADANGVFTVTLLLKGLEKYDPDTGAIRTWAVTETAMYASDGTEVPVENGSVTLDGHTISASVRDNGVKPKDPGHFDTYYHFCDTYDFAGSNNRTGSYPLSANKVWWDEGDKVSGKRPDVRFSIWRVSAKGELAGLIASGDRSGLIGKLEDMHKAGQTVIYMTDKIWQTQLNEWYWTCGLGSVPRYDGNGYPWIYYAVETTTASDEYKIAYYSGTDKPDRNAKTAEDTLPVAGSVDSAVLTVLSDGITSSGLADTRFTDSWSGTVINYPAASRSVCVRKLWKLPAEFSIPEDEMPAVEICLYRTLTDLDSLNYPALKAWLQDPAHQADGTVACCTLTLDYDMVYDHNHFSKNFTKDSAGHDLPKYNEYGQPYYYYVIEPRTGTDTALDNYPESEVFYSPGTYTLQNEYEPGHPAVKIPVRKTWTIAEGAVLPEGMSIRDLLPAEFTLYAQAVSRTNHSKTVGKEIKIASCTLSVPTDTPVTDTSCTVTRWIEYIGDDESKGALPYQAPNGVPYVYYIKETPLKPDKAYKTAEPAAGTSFKDPIVLMQGADNIWTAEPASVAFTNTYTGDPEKQSLSKIWADDISDLLDAAPRPDSLTLYIRRKYTDSKNNTVTDTKEYTCVATAADSVNNNTGWKVTIENAETYTPDGRPYTYFVYAESWNSETAKVSEGVLHHYTVVLSGSSIKNTLKTVSATSKKKWTVNGQTMTASDLTLLRSFGALPDAVGFALQRSSDGKNWNWVGAKSGKGINAGTGAESVIGKKWTVASLTCDQLQSLSFSCSKLPEYCGAGSDAKWQYRFAELVWKGTVLTVIEPDAQTHNVQILDSAYKPMSSAGSVNGTETAFTNDLSMTKVVIRKIWDDSHNRDNTRPGSLTLILTGAGGKTEREIAKPSAHINDDIYSFDDITVPALAAATPESMAAAYTLTESPDYSKPGALYTCEGQEISYNSQTKAYTFTLTNTCTSRAKISLKADKSWAGDSGVMSGNTRICDVTRPAVIWFELLYAAKDSTDDNHWLTINDNPPADILSGIGNDLNNRRQIADTTAETGNSAIWPELNKYWSLGQGEYGTAKPIRYAVRETLSSGEKYLTLYLADGTAAKDTNASYKPDSSTDRKEAKAKSGSADEYSVSFTNTLVTAALPVTKAWQNGSGTEISPEAVTHLVKANILPEKITFRISYSTDSKSPFTELKTVTFTTEKLLSAGCEVTGLPLYSKTGSAMIYKAEEISAVWTDGEESTLPAGGVTPDSAKTDSASSDHLLKGVSFVNTVSLGKLTLEKLWDDERNRDNTRPIKLVFNIARDGKALLTVTVTRQGNESGNPLTAAVTHPDGSAFQEITATVSSDGGWLGNKWTVEISGLPVTKAGSADPSVYTVTEDTVKKYTTRSEPENGQTGTGSTVPVRFTNSYAPLKGSVRALKTFIDASAVNHGTFPPVTLTLQYAVSGGDGTDWYDVGDEAAPEAIRYSYNGATVTLNGSEEIPWTALWQGLRINWFDTSAMEYKPLYYRVIEEKVNGTEDAKDAYVIREASPVTLKDGTPAEAPVDNIRKQTRLDVRKRWLDEKGDPVDPSAQDAPVLPDSLTVKLQFRTADTGWKDAVSDETGETVTMELKGSGWSGSFDNLALYDTDGSRYMYRVLETAMTFGETVIPVSKNGTRIGEWLVTYGDTEETETSDEVQPVTVAEDVINTVIPMGDLSVSKKLTGAAQERNRAFRLTVTLDGGAKYDLARPYDTVLTRGKEILREEPLVFSMKNGKATASFDLRGGQTLTVLGIPAGVAWQVTEQDYSEDGYETAYKNKTGKVSAKAANEVTVTNKRLTGDLTVRKLVQTEGTVHLPEDGFSFTVTLTGPDGMPYGHAVQTVDGNGAEGSVTFTDGQAALTLRADEQITLKDIPYGSTYSVTEQAYDGVTAEWTGGSGFIPDGEEAVAICVNTVRETFTEIRVIKKWDDADNRDKKRPESVTVSVSDQFGPAGQLVLNEGNGWTAVMTELPCFSESGEKLIYTVAETDVPDGYKVIYSVSGNTVTVINRYRPVDTVLTVGDYSVPLSIGLNMNEGDCLN